MDEAAPAGYGLSPTARNRWLMLLHRYNGWNVLFLLVTGLVLFFPSLRGLTAPIRVPLKNAHIASGVAMVILLAAYLPLASGHVGRLRRRIGQQLNVALLVAVTLGWTGTGMVLWLHRQFPPEWASAALLWHDYLTWIIAPWLAIHSVTRYFKWRLILPQVLTGRLPVPATGPNPTRRAVLTALGASVAGLAWTATGWPLLVRGLGGPDGTTDIPAPAVRIPAGDPPPLTKGQPPMPVPARTPITGGGRRGSFRIYTVTAGFPAFRPDLWRFQAAGLVDRPLELGWEDFLRLPRAEQVSDFHCVTGWSVYRITWEGVRLSQLIDRLGVQPGADHVKFYSGDGEYTDDLPLTVALADDIMLAYLIDGQPLPIQLGGPVRLIVPRMYAYKSVKWTQGLELIRGPHEGYWEERGYPRDAWVQRLQQ